ncbi:MAG: polysaccharide biosynthesis C-terminal domain-containing protein [Flavobacteriales bacterium]|nr:polysaccharide biosynthesis C-terminal domain-containing protein [Flavobacteriales bacterium]
MIKNIINTIGSKLGISLISFILLIINSNYLGAAGLGSVGLIVLSITIVLLLSNLVNTSIVYFASRHNTGSLFFVSYIWSVISVLFIYLLNQVFPFFPQEFGTDLYLLAFLQSGIVIHLNVLLGKEKIKSYNFYTVLQSTSTLAFLCFFFFVQDKVEVQSFINALFGSYSIVLFFSFINVIPHIKNVEFSSFVSVFKDAFQYGFFIQSASIFQLLNYRISYFILDLYSGRASLGLYSAGVQLSEALLLPGKSIAVVQYARISKKKNEAYAQRITLLFMKLSILLTGIGTFVLLLLPSSFLTWLLGDSFFQIKSTIFAMSLGIIALSAEIILSHYFSGTGRQKKNSTSSFIGLSLTLIFAYLLIPTYGAVGAALTSSIAFSGMLIYLFVLMNKHKGVHFSQFLPQQKDWILIRRILLRYRK